jgi:serine phosphatase RsbU (regulator of sigma subunit)
VVARPGGGTDVLWRSVGLPLGFPGQGACAGVKVGLPAGSTLALYSDGLVQTPSRTLDEGIAELQRALAVTAALPIRAACDTIASRLAVGGRDDATLVLVRVPGRERLGTPLRPAAHG